MREVEGGQDESGDGTDGETEERRLSRPKESKPLGGLPVGLRTGQERVKILDCRKEGRTREEEETELTQVRAREKNWIVAKGRGSGKGEEGHPSGHRGVPGSVFISRVSRLNDATRV